MRTEQFMMADNPYQPNPGYASASDRLASDAIFDPSQASSAEAEVLRQRGKNGANWFFWIAALSLINSIILHNGGDMFFVVGLGVTALADQIALLVINDQPEIESGIHLVAMGFAAIAALVVAGFGWASNKRWLSIYAIGMVLYLLDGLLFVMFEDWMSVGFHAFALFWMINGFNAYRQLRAIETASY
jgi:hypothetical protein